MAGLPSSNEGRLEDRLRNMIIQPSGNVDSGTSVNTATRGTPNGGGHRRPNQAQRRQMAAETTIPVNHDSLAQPSSSSFRGHGGHHFGHRGGFHHNRGASFDGFSGGFPRGAHHHGGPQHEPHHPHHKHMHFSRSNHERDQGREEGMEAGGWPERGQRGHRGLFDPRGGRGHRGQRGRNGPQHNTFRSSTAPEAIQTQAEHLDAMAIKLLREVQIGHDEIVEKENFRANVEQVCRQAIWDHENQTHGPTEMTPDSITLKCFGSLASGFATKDADLDLGLLSPQSSIQPDNAQSPIPRLLEKVLLDLGLGARLLTNARVPIIKLCERPAPELLQGLREALLKRESGSIGNKEADQAGDERMNDPADRHPRARLPSNSEGAAGATMSPTADTSELHVSSEYREHLSDIRQQRNMKLQNYYILVKKVLRNLGGRDITPATVHEFQHQEFELLNQVCHAFIDGLSDEVLRKRLQNYKSLQPTTATDMTVKNRSIYGVLAQIEGEQLVMEFEKRVIKESDEQQEKLAENRVRFWQSLQNRKVIGHDPLADNKDLTSALDALKKVPSLELLSLEQDQYTTASQYWNKFQHTMRKLAIDIAKPVEPLVLSTLTKQYIRGISIQPIRDQLMLEDAAQPGVSPVTVAWRHKSLQLAYEFERALEKGSIPAHAMDHVSRYKEVLRQSINLTNFFATIPIKNEDAAVYTTIRSLPDPATLSTNQPRDRYKDVLDFPKSGVGIQCDINFSAHLALQNTKLLRCYSLQDPRVHMLVLFVKHWAKARGINTAYRGTLSSYGYVLMVLHFLVNVVQPPICLNLQLLAPPPTPFLSAEEMAETVTCHGRDVRFWRDEVEISQRAREGRITRNSESLGLLLRGFFEYYAHSQLLTMGHMYGFDWGRDCLSIRSSGGVLSKQSKGWTAAKTILISGAGEDASKSPQSVAVPVFTTRQSDFPALGSPDIATQPSQQSKGPQQKVSEQQQQPIEASTATTTTTTTQRPAPPPTQEAPTTREVRNRYLFAIEDPFETDHNVARTVTHEGIVAIRDEFRRAWRIIQSIGATAADPTKSNTVGDGAEAIADLLLSAEAEKAAKQEESSGREREEYLAILNEIHGKYVG